MPVLEWLDKDKAVKASKDVKFRLLEEVPEFSCGENRNNVVVQGDNLEALKALLPYYKGQVKCIYIDPPYNTGNAFEHYDDNVEHSTWLSLMYPRLDLLNLFLQEDGFFCCQIDDSEGHYLKMLLDEIFERRNYVISFYIRVRYPEKTLKQDMLFHKEIEQILVYKKSKQAKPNLITEKYDYAKFNKYINIVGAPVKTIILGGKRTEIYDKNAYTINEDKPSENGLKEIWASGTILDGNSSGRFFRDYLAGRKETDGLGALYKVYDIGDDKFDYRYFTGPKRGNANKGKYYQGVPSDILKGKIKDKRKPIINFYDMAGDFGNCRLEGNVEFRGGKKPEILLETVLKYFSERGDIVMDSFLGSGTTAAVAHKMGRRYVGVEIGEQAVTHVVPRLQKVIEGEQGGISKSENWQGGGGFKFYRLGEALYDNNGLLNKNVKAQELGAFIFYKETQTSIDNTMSLPFLGNIDDVSYYLLFDSQKDTSLNMRTLKALNLKEGKKVIYADMCKLSKKALMDNKIEFKQIPYDVAKLGR